MKILIDNGHGRNTPGKCSPDKSLLEWEYNRYIAAGIVARLTERGYDAERIVTEDYDVSLSERTRRVNSWCQKLGRRNVILVSVHCNAAGSDNRWHSANGWSCFVTPHSMQRTRALAGALHDAASGEGLKTLRQWPERKYWEKNLAICRCTQCAAVLTENLFQDNRADVEYLLSPAGRTSIINLHVNGISNFLNTL